MYNCILSSKSKDQLFENRGMNGKLGRSLHVNYKIRYLVKDRKNNLFTIRYLSNAAEFVSNVNPSRKVLR